MMASAMARDDGMQIIRQWFSPFGAPWTESPPSPPRGPPKQGSAEVELSFCEV